MPSDEKWEIQPICKTCYYRRSIWKGRVVTYSTYWNNTACHYLIYENRLRDGKPQGDYCPNYKPKERREEENE